MPELIVLDRDGVITADISGYVLKPEDLLLQPGAKEAVHLLAERFRIVLATKQRCLSKGMLSYDDLAKIHDRLEELLDFKFYGIHVEPVEPLKSRILAEISLAYQVAPHDILFFDNSPAQCKAASRLGIQTTCTTDLLSAVKTLLA